MAVAKRPFAKTPKTATCPLSTLPKASEVLTTRTHRHLALLCKPTFVDDQRSLGRIPDQLIGITCNMIKHFTCTPFGVSDKLLQISIIGVRYHLRDRIDVFTRARLHQTRSILPGLLRHIPPVTLKVLGVTLHKTYKSIR